MTKILYENAGGVVQENKKSNWWNISKIINDLVAVANELRTDHLGTGTSYQVWATEMTTDHAGFKTAVDTSKTLTDELRTNNDLDVTLDTELKADLNDMNDYFDFLWEANGIRAGEFTMAGAAAVTIAVTTEAPIYWTRDGKRHFIKNLAATVALEDSGDIADTKFGAWRVLMSDLGVLTTQDTGAQMAFTDAQDAMLNLSHETPTASNTVVGFIVLENAQGGATPFNIGTTNTNAANVNLTFYYESGPAKQLTGLTAALGSTVVADVGAATWSSGTIDFAAMGINLAQIGAITNQAMDDADTIATTEAGGWLLVTDLAGTGVYALASDGVAGSVSVLADTDAAGVLTALGTLCDQLPGVFCPVGWITVVNSSVGTFTAGTTFWDATDMTTTIANATVGVWDRTNLTGFDTHKINPPALPDAVAAPGKVNIVAAAATAGPGTLGSSVPAALAASAVEDTRWRLLGTPT